MDQSTSPQPADKPHDAAPAPEGNQSQVPPRAVKLEQSPQKKDADDEEEDSDLDELDGKSIIVQNVPFSYAKP